MPSWMHLAIPCMYSCRQETWRTVPLPRMCYLTCSQTHMQALLQGRSQALLQGSSQTLLQGSMGILLQGSMGILPQMRHFICPRRVVSSWRTRHTGRNRFAASSDDMVPHTVFRPKQMCITLGAVIGGSTRSATPGGVLLPETQTLSQGCHTLRQTCQKVPCLRSSRLYFPLVGLIMHGL